MLDWVEASNCLQSLLSQCGLFKGKANCYNAMWTVRTLLLPCPWLVN